MNELNNDVLGALEKGTKPERRAPDFKRYDAADKNKDLKEVMEIAENKAKKKEANQAKSKTAYAVKNHF